MNQKISEMRLNALQSQMNPHFLFNAMASIQYLLKIKDMKKAEAMLTKFGKLLRQILNSSKVKLWTIEEEISLLKLYCDIEKERFEKEKIEIKFHVGNINSQRKIPPMIIQPFVENVFNHAFTKISDRQGHLLIDFSETLDKLVVMIKDDGIGIYHNAAATRTLGSTEKPKGLEITKERINLFSLETGKAIELEIDEQYKGNDFPGTKVIIKFPHIKDAKV
jgi:sensor histidine kinase YesM